MANSCSTTNASVGLFRDIPVVVVTGITRDDREMEAIIRSLLEPEHVPRPEAYLEKPVDAQRSLRTIEEALSSSMSAHC